MAVYHAYPYGKMNQSFKMEDENNASVFEANLLKFKLFSASDFEFVNCKTTVKEEHKVGKTVTKEEGVGSFNFSSKSYFKLDGKNCFEILEDLGYTLKIIAKLDILHPEFALVDKDGNTFASYKMNVKGEREENVMAIGNSQRNTLITTDSDDLKTAFLGAFILSRVDFSLYLV